LLRLEVVLRMRGKGVVSPGVFGFNLKKFLKMMNKIYRVSGRDRFRAAVDKQA
jgi:hypothetical protein